MKTKSVNLIKNRKKYKSKKINKNINTSTKIIINKMTELKRYH